MLSRDWNRDHNEASVWTTRKTPSNIRDESNTILCRIVKGNRCNMFMKVKGNHILKHNVIHKVKQIILIRNKVIKELSI